MTIHTTGHSASRHRLPLPLAAGGIGLLVAYSLPGGLTGGNGFLIGLTIGTGVLGIGAFLAGGPLSRQPSAPDRGENRRPPQGATQRAGRVAPIDQPGRAPS